MCIHCHTVYFCPLTCSSVFRAQNNLPEVSSLGHFLKGSSAALGVFKVQRSCEDIQNYGQLRQNTKIITEAEAIVKVTETLARAREEYEEAKSWLEWFYANRKGKESTL